MKKLLLYLMTVSACIGCTQRLDEIPQIDPRLEDQALIRKVGYNIAGIVNYDDGSYLVEGDIWIRPENLEEWRNDTVLTRHTMNSSMQKVTKTYQKNIFVDLGETFEYLEDARAAITAWNGIKGCNIQLQNYATGSNSTITVTLPYLGGENETLMKVAIPSGGKPGSTIQINKNCTYLPQAGSVQAKYMFMHALGHALGFAHTPESPTDYPGDGGIYISGSAGYDPNSIMVKEKKPLAWKGISKLDEDAAINLYPYKDDSGSGGGNEGGDSEKITMELSGGGMIAYTYATYSLKFSGPSTSKTHWLIKIQHSKDKVAKEYKLEGDVLSNIRFDRQGDYAINIYLCQGTTIIKTTTTRSIIARRDGNFTYDRYYAADFDGDGKDDIWFKDENGVWYIDLAANGFGEWDNILPNYEDGVPIPADYDGDGKTDIAIKNAIGTFNIDYASNGFRTWDLSRAGYGMANCVAVPGDFDGDGKADLSIRDSGNGWWRIDYAKNGFGTFDAEYSGYGNASDVPAVADYDGDGKTDLAVKTSSGLWRIDYAKNGFGKWDVEYSKYGIGGATMHYPVPGDYDGDGKADLSERDHNGYWRIDYANNGFGKWDASHLYYEKTGCLWMPGDYDGDGKTDIAWMNPDRIIHIDFAKDGFWVTDKTLIYPWNK